MDEPSTRHRAPRPTPAPHGHHCGCRCSRFVCKMATGELMSDPAVAEVHASAAERSKVRAVRALVGKAPGPVRVQAGDEDVDLPRSLVRVLLAAADSLDEGDSVVIVAEEADISPAQAAKLLGVSRQYVDRLVGAEILPAHRLLNSTYRKIPVRAVLAYKKTRDRKREGIRKIVADATAAGLEY